MLVKKLFTKIFDGYFSLEDNRRLDVVNGLKSIRTLSFTGCTLILNPGKASRIVKSNIIPVVSEYRIDKENCIFIN